uniref:Cyclin Dx n=1 Tax=Oncorhynchus kisutch TaxID=8019 RepID=A0A8C7CTZ1_ONCKI
MSVSVSLLCEEEVRGQQGQGAQQGQARGHSQLRAPWDPSVSGQRIIQRLLQVEERYLPSALYVALIQREPERREELAKWAMEVCCERGCDETVFPLSVSMLDCFLSASLSLPVSPYCLAAACILIASKLTDFLHFQNSVCDNMEMERVILATLRWDVAAVTAQDFIPHFLPPVGERKDGKTDTEEFFSTLRRHSDTLVAMCVCDYRFLGAPPSLVAAAALNSALRGLGNKGPGHLGHMSATLAELCQTDLVSMVLQCYSELIEAALKQRLRGGLQDSAMEKDGEIEDERAGTPTDMREIDF